MPKESGDRSLIRRQVSRGKSIRGDGKERLISQASSRRAVFISRLQNVGLMDLGFVFASSIASAMVRDASQQHKEKINNDNFGANYHYPFTMLPLGSCSKLGVRALNRFIYPTNIAPILHAARTFAAAQQPSKSLININFLNGMFILTNSPTLFIVAAWNTKIVCTIGPASSDESVLEKMILAGMDVCRLNFSHGKYEEHQETFDKIRRLGEKYDNQVAILCDIQGPKIRTGKMKEPFEVAVGDKILVTPNDVVGTPDIIQISYETLVQDLDAGDFIFINDGTVKLEVEAKDTAKNELLCEVKTAGKISDNKGCNMPSGRLSVNVVTEKDARDLEYIAKNLNPEFVAASFIGTGEDVRKVRAELAKNGNDKVKIISKLERPVALENLEEIIKESDSIMVARGDLGVEIEAWDVPSWQKKAIFLSNKNSKPVIVATQVGIIIVCLPPTYCFSAAPPILTVNTIHYCAPLPFRCSNQ